MDTKPIEIIIKGTAAGEGQAAAGNGIQPTPQADAQEPTAPEKKKMKQGLQWDLKASSINLALKNQAMQFMNTALGQYGNITGDYSTVKNITAMMNMIGYATDLAMGPIGWINAAGKITMQAFTQSIQWRREQYEIDRTLDRYGAIYTQGGRGTNE